jgi:hypothetical protein
MRRKASHLAGRRSRRANPALVKALARAFPWRRMLEEGRFGSLHEFAKAEKVDRSHVTRLLRLTLPAPGIVEAILDGRHHPEETTPSADSLRRIHVLRRE